MDPGQVEGHEVHDKVGRVAGNEVAEQHGGQKAHLDRPRDEVAKRGHSVLSDPPLGNSRILPEYCCCCPLVVSVSADKNGDVTAKFRGVDHHKNEVDNQADHGDDVVVKGVGGIPDAVAVVGQEIHIIEPYVSRNLGER